MPRSEKPIDMTRGPVAEFAAELRELRRAAGTPTYRQMAKQANYSITVLSQAAAGVTVPPWSVVAAFVSACGGDRDEWQQRWHSMRRDQEVHDAAAAQPPPSEPASSDTFQEVRDAQDRQINDPRQQATSAPLRVFVLDDHELIRSGLRMLLEAEPDITVIGEAATAAEANARIPALKPDVAILDIRLPDGDGISVCREVRTAVDPPPACLMFTSYSDDDALFGAIMAGAAGYMLKQVSGAALVKAVRTVAAGGSLLDSTLTTSVMNRLRGETNFMDPRYEQLTQQERRVLDHIADGLTNRQIAEKLYLSEKTVKNHVSSVLTKLGLERRTAAAVYATERRTRRRN